MMNLIAMWMLVSSLGAAIFMSPEPLIMKTPDSELHPMLLAKEATKESLHYASEAARRTGENIRRSVTSASQIPAKAAHTVQRKAGEAAQAIKGGSQAGLEKIGLGQHIERPSHLESWESGLQAYKEKVDALKDTTTETAQDAKQGLQDTLGTSFGKEEKPPTQPEVIKEKLVDGYHAIKDGAVETAEAAKNKAEQEATAVKDTVNGTGQWIQDGAHDAYQSTEFRPSAVTEKASNAAGYSQEKISETAENVDELASKIAQSVEDNINAAGGTASETVGSAYEQAADGLKETAAITKTFVGTEEGPSTYQDRIQQATEQAADILRSRGKEAASYLPNVGQGLAYVNLDTHEKRDDGDYASIAGERKEQEAGFKNKVGGYVEGVKKKLKGAAPTAKTGDWREELLNKLGIYSEKDLSMKDIMVGHLKGYFSGGLFHKAGEALGSAATATRDAAYSAREKALESMSKAGEAVEHTTDVAVDKVKHVAGTDTIPELHDDYYNLTQSSADEDHSLRNRAAKLYKKVAWISTAWLLSSCRTAHLFAFSSVYGTSLWVTFVSGYILSRSVPRHQYGDVQSRVFPTYLKLIASGQAVCLLLYVILHPWEKASVAEKRQYLDLWGVLISTLANVFFLEPRAAKVMSEKLKVEKEEGKGLDDLTGLENDQTKARLGKINNAFHLLSGLSSIANLLSLVGMTWHLLHLSRRLVI